MEKPQLSAILITKIDQLIVSDLKLKYINLTFELEVCLINFNIWNENKKYFYDFVVIEYF